MHTIKNTMKLFLYIFGFAAFVGSAEAAHTHCLCGDGKCEVGGHAHNTSEWAPWTKTDSLPDQHGYWYLTADVNLTVDYNAPYDVNLCLNGHTVTQTTTDKRVITISATDLNKTFRLTDCRGTGKVTGGKLTSGGHGAGVFLNTTATATAIFELYGGSICGNRAEKTDATSVACGGGVYVGKSCQFAMYGGSITNNVANGNQSNAGTGGGVYAFGKSTVAIYGGDICGNTASRYAGGIESLGALTVGPKARVYGNIAGAIAGICCENNSSATFKGGEIFNNKAQGGLVSDGVGGVGIYTSDCTFSDKVVITDNLNGDKADDLYLDSGKTIVLNGLASGSRIGVRLANPPTLEGDPKAFTSNGAATDRAYFFSNHDGCPVTYGAGHLVIEKATMVRVTPTAVANTTVSVLDNNVPVAPNADGICRVANGADMVKIVYTAAPGYEFAGSQTKQEIVLSMEETENDPVVPATPMAPTLVKSLVVPAAVAHATAKIYQGATELTDNPYLVALNAADVKVVYTAADGYMFEDGTTAKTNAVDASVNPASIAAAPAAPAFIIDSSAKLDAALDYVNDSAAADEDIRWYVSADFTMTAAAKIEKKVASLTILSNGRTLTAEQNGSLITAVFDFVSSDLADIPVVIKDLKLTVKDGFRHGFNLWRSGIDAHCVQLTLDNVNITLAHTTQPMKGSTPKDCAAIINNYNDVILTNGCLIAADAYCWAAIDLTSTNGCPAAITIASDDITFVDNRTPAMAAIKPLVKVNEEGGSVAVSGMEKTALTAVTLQDGPGYSYAVSFKPTSVANATNHVFVGEKEMMAVGSSYQLPSNGTVTVVYTADEDYMFKDGQKTITRQLDTTVSPAIVKGVVPEDAVAQWVDVREITIDTRERIVIASPSEVLSIAYSTNNWGQLADGQTVTVLSQRHNPEGPVVTNIDAAVENGYLEWQPIENEFGRYNFGTKTVSGGATEKWLDSAIIYSQPFPLTITQPAEGGTVVAITNGVEVTGTFNVLGFEKVTIAAKPSENWQIKELAAVTNGVALALDEAKTSLTNRFEMPCYETVVTGAFEVATAYVLAASNELDVAYAADLLYVKSILSGEELVAATNDMKLAYGAGMAAIFAARTPAAVDAAKDAAIAAVYEAMMRHCWIAVEFNAMGGFFTNDLEVITNDCPVTDGYVLPDLPIREDYALIGWFDSWTNGAQEVTNGQALVKLATHTIYAQWKSTKIDPGHEEEKIDVNVLPDGSAIIKGPAAGTEPDANLVFPETVKDGDVERPFTVIGEQAYLRKYAVESVAVPLYVTNVRTKAFYNCSQLKKLTFVQPRDYKTLAPCPIDIGSFAFANIGITDLVIPAGVVSVGQQAFAACGNLTNVIIRGTFQMNGQYPFLSCGRNNPDVGVTIHLAPAAATNEMFVAWLTAGCPNVRIAQNLDGQLVITAIDLTTPGYVYLTFSYDGAAMVNTKTISAFYGEMNDPGDLMNPTNRKALPALEVVPTGVANEYKAKFESPGPGFFRVSIDEYL